MTDGPPEDELAQEAEPLENPDAEEYQPDEGEVSRDTGTVYEGDGEPEATPRDEVSGEDEAE